MSSHQKNPRGVRRPIENQGHKKIEKPRKPLLHGTPEAKARHSVLLGSSLFLSGTAALVFQVLWVKQLSLVVGVEVYSVTVAVSAFFAGLALGGTLLGRFADRWQRPLLLYASLETAVAITGVTTTMALSHTPAIFAFLSQRVGMLAWLLPFLLVGVPAFVMGGTIPAATRWRTLQNLPDRAKWCVGIRRKHCRRYLWRARKLICVSTVAGCDRHGHRGRRLQCAGSRDRVAHPTAIGASAQHSCEHSEPSSEG